VYFGADGHINQAGPYANVPLSQQIADLKFLFGNTPNTIFYRALDAAMASPSSRLSPRSCSRLASSRSSRW
jgi:hypothetical protein